MLTQHQFPHLPIILDAEILLNLYQHFILAVASSIFVSLKDKNVPHCSIVPFLDHCYSAFGKHIYIGLHNGSEFLFKPREARWTGLL